MDSDDFLYRNPTSCGAGLVLTPSNEADRVAPVALTFEDETAVMFPSPEVTPPDGSQFSQVISTSDKYSAEDELLKPMNWYSPVRVTSTALVL